MNDRHDDEPEYEPCVRCDGDGFRLLGNYHGASTTGFAVAGKIRCIYCNGAGQRRATTSAPPKEDT